MRRFPPAVYLALGGGILLAGIAAVWLLGAWAVVIPSVLGLVMVIGAVVGAEGVSGWIAWLLAGLGGIIGVASAASALVEVGGNPDYSGQAILGWAALLLAVIAALAALLIKSRLILAVILMIFLSTLGFLLMNLFYINSWYFAGMLLFWCAAVAALTARPEQSY